MKAIINARIYDFENYIENGFVIYNESIIDVGDMKDYNGHYELYDAKGKLLIPGLINGHTHIYSTLFRGAPLQASPNNFLEILDQIWWKFDKELTLPSIRESAKAYGQMSLLCGVTSLIDHHASGEIIGSLEVIHEELDKLKMKHLLCFETSDRFDIKECIEENTHTSIHKGHFGLHASLSLSDETLEQVSLTVEDKPIHIHVAESQIDEDLCQSNHECSVVERLNSFNLLNKDSILAHCLYINDLEASIIKEKECYVAINPSSNLNNAVGLYNNKILMSHDIPVLVGTDGLGANIAKAYQNLYYVGNQSRQHPSEVGLEWIKKQLMTSYDYVNRLYGCRLGRIKKEYDSDFLLIDYDSITPMNQDNIFAHMIFGVFEALRPYAVFIRGELQVDQNQLVLKEPVNQEIIEALWRNLI